MSSLCECGTGTGSHPAITTSHSIIIALPWKMKNIAIQLINLWPKFNGYGKFLYKLPILKFLQFRILCLQILPSPTFTLLI